MAPFNEDYYNHNFTQGLGRLKEIVDLQWNVIENNIHLIASACYPFKSVLQALCEPSFVLPAEGMPGSRYLPGAMVMDLVEIEGEKLVLKLFNIQSGYRVSLQPHSGTQANQIVYNAVLKQNDIVLCLNTRDGGHISHTVLISRKNKTYNYGLTVDGYIDYESLRRLALEHNPKLIIVGGSALPREIDFKTCKNIADECGAYLHADISHTATFIAAGVHSNAFPYCDFATFNTVKNLRGPNGGVLIYREEFLKSISSSIFPCTQGGANETNMLGKYACFLEWTKDSIENYAQEITNKSKLLGTILQNYGIRLTSGGTDCHILLLELYNYPRTGAGYEKKFESLRVLLNKNLIPNDKRSPTTTSGIRIGTTNLAILEYEDDDIAMLGHWIANVILTDFGDASLIDTLTAKYNKKFSRNTY